MDESFYDNDLQLAAELGKILLDRNKELEAQFLSLQQITQEKDEGIALLTKQVEVLRHANDSRMRIYEEIDKNAQELEKTNESLRKAAKDEKEKVKSLTETVESLELRCDELQAQIEQHKRDKKASKKENEYNRTWSVPSLTEDNVEYKGLSPGSYDYLGFPSLNQFWSKKKTDANTKEIKDLKESVRTVKLQYFAEQNRRIGLEADLSSLKGDNEKLLEKLKEIEEAMMRKEEMKKEMLSANEEGKKVPHPPVECAKCPSRAASVAGSDIGDGDFIEHDLDEIPHKEVVRLKCGGSAYGSRESLNQIGLEAVTPTLESCSDILAVAVHQNPDGTCTSEDDDEANTASTSVPDPDSTLLGELEEQYRKLVRKYEHLVEIKQKREVVSKESSTQNSSSKNSTVESTEDMVRRRPKTLTISKEVQTAWRKSSCLDFTSPADPTEGHFEKGPPEYKKLFKEIFETLQKAATDAENGDT